MRSLSEAVCEMSITPVGRYEPYWGLHTRPFENVPDPKSYVSSVQHDTALASMLYGIQARKGIVMLTGEIGNGKTLMSRAIILRLPRDQYKVELLSNPTMPGNKFLGEILFQLWLDPSGTRAEQLRRLTDQLLANYHRGADTVIVVDEAEAIEHDRVFQELRLLSNFQLNDRFLITLVLVGQPELRDRIAGIPQLAQRVAIHHHLECLDRAEAKAYIAGRLATGGCGRSIFTSGAISAIVQRTKGVCRVMNSLCDLCLYVGCLANVRQIRRPLVERTAGTMLYQQDADGVGVFS